MSKITLTDLVNLQNETTAVNAINGNNAVIETAFDNTLSRDGSAPNSMEASIDMDSNRILNLPSPTSANEPVRLQDLANYATGGTVTFNGVPNGGSAGASLIKNSSVNQDVTWGGNSLSFDIRSDVTTSRIPSSITSIVINRYDTGYPVQPAVYTRGNVSSTLALLDAGGNYWGLSGNTAYPEYFGAKVDGTTDDAPAIRSCMTYLKNVAPSVMFLGIGTYLLGTYTSTGSIQTAIVGYNGVSIKGQGNASILKLKTNFLPTLSFSLFKQANDTLADAINNASFTDFKIDGNVAGNNYNQYMPCFYISHNNSLTFQNLFVQNWPGSQIIALGYQQAGLGGASAVPTSTNPMVTDCYFLDNCSNTLITDFSAVFVCATDFLIHGNWCSLTAQSQYGTAIEVHGTGTCVGNVVRNHNKAFNVGSNPDTSAILDGNHAYNVYTFATIWETLGGANPDFNTKCVVSNNVCFLKDSTLNHAIDLINTRGISTSSVRICNNYFESLEAAGTATVNGCIYGGKVKDLEVTGNTAMNFPGPFFFNGVDPVNDVQVLRVDGNTIIDCGRSSTAGARYGISIQTSNRYNVLSLCNNIIKNTSTVYMTTGIISGAGLTATTGRGRIDGNFFFNITTNINWVGSTRMEGIWISYTPTLTASTGTATSASATGKYRLLYDTCQFQVVATVTTVGTAANDMIMTLPFTNAAFPAAFAGKETTTGKAVAASSAGSGTTIVSRFYDNTTAWANSNNVVVSGTYQIA